MKSLFSTLSILMLFIGLHSQTVADGVEIHYKNPAPIETEQFKIEFQNVIAENTFAKLKVIFTNKTSEYVLVDLAKVTFVYKHGTYQPDGKLLIIEPLKSKSKVLSVKGDNRFYQESFSLKFDGLATLPLKGDPLSVADFRLPPESKDFSTGTISCSIGKLKKESRITSTSFSCKYTGDKFLVVNPLSISAKLEDGQTFPNVAKPGGGLSAALSGPAVMQQGDKQKVPVEFRISTKIIDMQFATFWIVWNETFSEASATSLGTYSVGFTIDPGMTEAQNK